LFHEVRRALPDAYVDVAFFPTARERKLFEREGMPFLTGAQSLRPAGDFDLVLVSNAYTLELINLPYLLIHSGIPLFSSQRRPQKAKASSSRNARDGLPNPPLSAGFGNPAGANRDLLT
jgi:hypothetical protein